MAFNKETTDLLSQLIASGGLSEDQQAIIKRQLEQDQKDQQVQVQGQVQGQDNIKPRHNGLKERLGRFLGLDVDKVQELGDDAYAVDINDLDNASISNNGSLFNIDDRLSQLQSENKVLKDKVEAMQKQAALVQKQAMDEKLNKLAFDAIQKEGYDPAKIGKIIKPSERLKVENGQVVGLNELMQTIKDAGFVKAEPKDAYNMLQMDWTTDYQQPKEKSGLDAMMDKVFGVNNEGSVDNTGSSGSIK